MGHVTKEFAEWALKIARDGKHPAVTAHEQAQFIYGWMKADERADAIERLSAERDKLKHDLKMAFSEDDKLIVMKQMQTEINAYKERIAELEKDKADFHMQYRMKCDEETKRLELRIALLESGQPCEVRGEMWQLVRVEASENELVAIGETMALQDGADPHQLIWQGNPPEPYGEILHTYFSKAREIRAAMLAASAQEMKKPQPPETPK